MELKGKTKRPVKKLLSSSLNKLQVVKQRLNRFFAEKYSANTKTPALLKAQVLNNDFELTCCKAVFFEGVDFTTALKQSNAVNWIVGKNLFTRLKVVLITSES